MLYFNYVYNEYALNNINIIDINGKLVYSNRLDMIAGVNNVAIDISKLAKGIYILQINNTDNSFVKKFIK